MDEAVILHVNLIPPAVGKRAAGGCELLLCGRVLGVNPLRPVRIYQIGAHVSISGIHDEAFFHVVRIEYMGGLCRLLGSAPWKPVSTCPRCDPESLPHFGRTQSHCPSGVPPVSTSHSSCLILGQSRFHGQWHQFPSCLVARSMNHARASTCIKGGR